MGCFYVDGVVLYHPHHKDRLGIPSKVSDVKSVIDELDKKRYAPYILEI
jgi:hypothetical protein